MPRRWNVAATCRIILSKSAHLRACIADKLPGKSNSVMLRSAVCTLRRSSTVAAPTAKTAANSAPMAAPQAAQEPMFKVTLTRSPIGLPERTKLSLKTLGLKKRMQTVYKPHRPEFAGMILKVKELVTVENVTAKDVPRKPAAGFEII
ncbi:uncharacterized protein L969DRAFT_53712 [Mixia osmundae IAM 14324]|uniref:Large ribosomal subunit protein uL30m n=1 Tax=Mixia osmundae (strain CBS 9802 / IAM 14324 / JCM 22182 / KY 12970) TaxID=764103 RepID=G7EB04_MIXOS|nr:uncharacterized protein L969DRAFT_53712 [Mixia osmundae IAM 14324]KEI37049.1 hypothetical protein L969DRAFT_53712 [Mixia osmundae IAM 14324]GAB00015.1 hypothetical protein E5Q_06717 [Mixia osmundae IAM 14324]